LAVHIYQARQRYRTVADLDLSKSGRRTQITAQMSYRKACTLGYRGSESDWRTLLQCGTVGETAN